MLPRRVVPGEHKGEAHMSDHSGSHTDRHADRGDTHGRFAGDSENVKRPVAVDLRYGPRRRSARRRPLFDVEGFSGRRLVAALLVGCAVVGGALAVATRQGGRNVHVRILPKRLPTACAASDCRAYAATMKWGIFPPWGHMTTGYNVFCAAGGSSCNGRSPYGTTMGTSYTLTGMDCGTTFTLGVQAHDSGSDTSNTISTNYSTPPCGSGGAPAYTPNVYVAQTAAGSGDASSCANAESVASLNANAHSEWSAGNVIGLCGTITRNISAAGSGSAGNPIVLYWEPNASMTLSAASCTGSSSSCINLSGRSYITLDGGSNGVFQVTDNGDESTYNSAIRGVQLSGSSNITIEYLTIKNIYVHHSGVEQSTDAVGVWVANSSNFVADHNTFSNAGNVAIVTTNTQSDGSLTVSNNDFSGDNWNVGVTAATNSSQGPVYIFGNHFHDDSSWDDPNDYNHHNGIFCYTAGDTTYDPHYTGFYIYNNLFNGFIGNDSTAWVNIQSCSDDTTAYYVFNDIFADTTAEPGNGDVAVQKGIDPTYNNTLWGTNNQGILLNARESGKKDFRNDLSVNGSTGEQTREDCGGSAPTGWPCPTYSANNNIYTDTTGSSSGTGFICPPYATQYGWSSSGWSSWKSCINSYLSPGGSDETNSFGPPGSSQTVTDPKLDSNYAPTSGSPTLGTGQNLYSICNGQPNPGLGALCQTYAGPTPSGTGAGPNGQWATPTARPSTGAWNIGAY